MFLIATIIVIFLFGYVLRDSFDSLEGFFSSAVAIFLFVWMITSIWNSLIGAWQTDKICYNILIFN